MKCWQAVLAIVPLLFSAGCMVGPKYKVPVTPMAPAYKEPPPAEFKEGDGWKTAQPGDAALRADWWEIFGDSTLNSLEQQIAVSNQNLKSEEARFRQARALVRFHRADLFPTISTVPSIQSARLSQNRPLGTVPGNYGDFALPVDLGYEVDLWGRVRHSVEAAKEEFQATAGDLQTLKLSLQAELALTYFELRSLDAQKKILDDTVVQYQRALELTQNRFQGGLSARSEVAQAKTQLESARAQDIDLGVLRSGYEHAVAVLTGQTPEVFTLPALPLNLIPPVIPVGVPSQLLERRPDIASAERRVAEANAQIGIAQAAFYPTLILSATAGFEGGSIMNWLTWPSRFWAVGPQLAQTLFDAGRRRATSQSAVANYDALVAGYRQVTLTAFQQVEDNLSALRVLSEEAKTQRVAVESAEQSLELSTNRYKGGLVTYLEVITAQSIALANQRTEVDILRRRMDASVLLIKALGGGWNTGLLPTS